ncbi:hypothetical protein HIM_06740 [Hirsutella minnesotensis 3608]|uniref:Uncharacterized protein n=1 Tax=Hirsutella minnesotensis 3608 TaxID=1043627 RepID=A0A0F7ZZ98_9HYPO|nr:hypothetical protein HIM_06740 [Hirsutella minnesotensis 3608]
MELRALIRPAARLLGTARCIGAAPSIAPASLVPARGHKTTARTKRSLKIAPHDSFLPDRSRLFPRATAIVYNPPPSQAPPEHTPLLFLPDCDPRKAALVRARDAAAAATDETHHGNVEGLPPTTARTKRSLKIAPHDSFLPDRSRLFRNPSYHLGQAEIEEMRRLRHEDPLRWSTNKLAKKFNCSTVFVSLAARPPAEHIEFVKKKLEKKKARWGLTKALAREARHRRNEMLFRGQL